MFNKQELNYLFAAVESKASTSTQEARQKASMMVKLCDLLDVPDMIEAQPEKDSPEKAGGEEHETSKEK